MFNTFILVQFGNVYRLYFRELLGTMRGNLKSKNSQSRDLGMVPYNNYKDTIDTGLPSVLH